MNRILFNRILAINIDFLIIALLSVVSVYFINQIGENYQDLIVSIFFSIFFLYFSLFEYILNQTIRKKIVVLQVEFENKTLLNAFIRTFLRFYPFNGLPLLTKKDAHKTFHDKISKSKVVEKESRFW